MLSEVGSTNNYAMGRIAEGPVGEGTIYLAHNQVAGKGQRGKSWQSAAGQNITMSVVLTPRHLPLSAQFMLSAAIALASYDFVKKYAGDSVRIKWSNDIYWNDKKAGGMLIENVIRGKTWNYAIAGIGINVNQQSFDPALPNPVSLSQISAVHYDVPALALTLAGCVFDRYARLSPERSGVLLDEYNQALYRRNQWAAYRQGGEIFEGRLLYAEPSGRLVLETKNGRVTAGFGDIEFVL